MIYVLDANAMIAVLNDEAGADIVEGLLIKDDTTAYAHAVNVCEVFLSYPARRNGD